MFGALKKRLVLFVSISLLSPQYVSEESFSDAHARTDFTFNFGLHSDTEWRHRQGWYVFSSTLIYRTTGQKMNGS